MKLLTFLYHKIIVRFLIFSTILIIVFTYGCEDINDIGVQILPSSDSLNVYSNDSAAVMSYTVVNDTVESSFVATGLLGSYFDPVFGKAKCDFLSQMVMSTRLDFGTSPVLDSVVLFLAYSRDSTLRYYYGNRTVAQHINIYELTKELAYDTTYYSNFNIGDYHDDTPLTDFTYTPYSLNDTLLRIKLPNTLGQKIMAVDSASAGNIVKFVSYFKGLYFKTDDQFADAAIVNFDLYATSTKMAIYYHNTKDTTVHNLFINNNCSNLNLFKHDYSGTKIADITTKPVPRNDSIVYLQAMNGLKTVLKFPNITNWKSLGDISINKAELLIKSDETDLTSEKFLPPAEIKVFGIDSLGNEVYLKEYMQYNSQTGLTYYSAAAYDALNHQFKLNITRYMQEAIRSGNCYGLVLKMSSSKTQTRRIVLKGGNNSDRIKLSIIYTKL